MALRDGAGIKGELVLNKEEGADMNVISRCNAMEND